MTMMKRKLPALVLCLALLGGCGPGFSQYPRASSSAPAAVEAQTLTIDIPRDADAQTQEALAQFAAAVLELSGGAVTIETVPNSDPLSALVHGATHMALADNQMLIEAEPALSLTTAAFRRTVSLSITSVFMAAAPFSGVAFRLPAGGRRKGL